MSPSHPPVSSPSELGLQACPGHQACHIGAEIPVLLIAQQILLTAEPSLQFLMIRFFYFFLNHPSSKTEAKTRRGRFEMKPSIKVVTCAVVLALTRNATKRVLSQPGLHSDLCQQKPKQVTKESRTGQPQQGQRVVKICYRVFILHN